MDPLLELIAQDYGTDIDQPLLGHLWQVDVVGQVVMDHRLVGYKHENLFHGEVLVLRYIQGLDLLVVHSRLPTSGDVLQEVDGDVV